MTTWHLDLYAEPDGLFLAALDDGGAIVAIGRVERGAGSLRYDVETTFDRMLSCCAEYPDSISTDRAEVFVRFGGLFRLTHYIRDGRSNAWVERHLRAALGCKLKTASTRESVARNGALISAFFWGSAVFVGAIWSTVAWVVLA
ncbi:MAG: hypothetical protein ACOY45_15565 [Pseudomonadota bacterium]